MIKVTYETLVKDPYLFEGEPFQAGKDTLCQVLWDLQLEQFACNMKKIEVKLKGNHLSNEPKFPQGIQNTVPIHEPLVNH